MSPRLSLAVALAFAVVGCAPPRPASPPAPSNAAAPLSAQGAWRLQSATDAGGRALLPRGLDYRLQFVDGRINVLGGCNRMFGDFRVAEGRLVIGPLASTRMACEGSKMQQDATLARLLEQPLSMAVLESHPEQLRLRAGNGDTLAFTALPLE